MFLAWEAIICLCVKLYLRVLVCLCHWVIKPYMWCYCCKSMLPLSSWEMSTPPSLSISHSPLSPPQSIGSNRSPPCIQGLSAGGGGGSRDKVIEREIYYWWCLLMTVESCSGPHERALLDNVCSCYVLRGGGGGVQNKTAKQNISKWEKPYRAPKQTTPGFVVVWVIAWHQFSHDSFNALMINVFCSCILVVVDYIVDVQCAYPLAAFVGQFINGSFKTDFQIFHWCLWHEAWVADSLGNMGQDICPLKPKINDWLS